ncbi:unnamed protein product [Rotaria sp. Silwood1]|nr:unnamed protein product [Rotaria sp. Silwood1]
MPLQVVEWQRALKPLEKQQQGLVSRNTIIKPGQRYDEIMNIVYNNQFTRDPYLKELSIHVDEQGMVQTKRHVLSPPEIEYHRGGT